jgi:hypothetical protein
MQALTARDATHPRVTQAAREAVIAAQLGPDASLDDIAQLAIFPWVKAHVRYVPESQLHTPFHTSDFARIDQQLIPPAALLAMPEPIGDCPDYSMLTAAMCRFWHIPTAFKSIAADKDQPHVFSHVYCVAQTEPGIFVPLDTSNAPTAGLEYATPTKSKLWPNHQDTTKETMIRNSALNRSRIARLQEPRFARLGTTDPAYDWNFDPDFGAPLSYASPAPSSPSQLPALFATIANDAAKIAAPIIAAETRQQPYYIQGSGGAQVLYDPNTGQVATAKTTATTDLATGVRAVTSAIPSGYLLAGLAILGIGAFAFSGHGRK